MKIFRVSTILIFMLVMKTTFAEAFCFEEAGRMYGISPQLLWVISKGESNFNPAAVGWNSNGSYDYGLMQINSSWAPTLKRIGVRWESLADPCTNVKVGAWILSQCFRDYGYSWEGVGCYNSRTPQHRNKYANRVARILEETRKTQQITTAKSQVSQPEPTPWEVFLPNDSK